MLPDAPDELVIPRRHLSFSQLQMIDGCPEQHRQKYILGKESVFSYEVLIGQASHKLPELCLRDIQEGRPMRSRSDALDAVAQYWREHENDENISFTYRFSGAPISKDKCLSDALKIARVMYDELIPTVSEGTWMSEWDFNVPIPGKDGWDFKGSIDHVRVIPAVNDGAEFTVIVDDWKTTGSMWKPAKAEESLQATAYCWAIKQMVGILPRRVTFQVFTRPTAKADVIWNTFETRRLASDLRKFEAKLKWAVKIVEGHSADPERHSLQIPEWQYHKYCQFRSICTPWELLPKDPVSIR